MIKLEFDNKKLQIDMNDLQNIIKIVENKPEIKSNEFIDPPSDTEILEAIK